MSEETYTFDQARARLEDIAKQTKGASLEKCLDLLEEGVKLANTCTEKIDHTRWRDEVEEAEGTDSAVQESDATPEDDAVDVDEKAGDEQAAAATESDDDESADEVGAVEADDPADVEAAEEESGG